MDWLERTLAQTAWVVLDTETTGLAPGLGNRVVEVAAVRLENGRRVAEFQQLINPERPQEARAAEITGLADEHLRDQPTFAEIAPRLQQFLEGAVIIAHNASFDANFFGAGIGHLPTRGGSARASVACAVAVYLVIGAAPFSLRP
ncbi:MAG: hypothetical protein IPL28_07005 [Chloroflexi bacterium]|nr:hypothetical protein [Chloroflexota bacterium]